MGEASCQKARGSHWEKRLKAADRQKPWDGRQGKDSRRRARKKLRGGGQWKSFLPKGKALRRRAGEASGWRTGEASNRRQGKYRGTGSMRTCGLRDREEGIRILGWEVGETSCHPRLLGVEGKREAFGWNAKEEAWKAAGEIKAKLRGWK